MFLAEIFRFPTFQSQFSHKDLSNHLSRGSIDWLRSQQILHTKYADKWFCNACVDFHFFEEFEEKLYRICPEDQTGSLGKPFEDQGREVFYIDFPRFIEVFCKKNKLKLLNDSFFNNSLLAGYNKDILVIYTTQSRKEILDICKKALLFLELSFPTVYVIRPKSECEVKINTPERERWAEQGIQEVDLEVLIKDFLVLPRTQALKEGKLPISIQGFNVFIGDESSTLTKTYTGIAKKLIDKEGKTIKDKQLHDVEALRNYISSMNIKLCEDCKLEHYPFIYQKNNSRLDTEFYTKK